MLSFIKKWSLKRVVLSVCAVIICLTAIIIKGVDIHRQVKLNRHVISEKVLIGEGTQWELNGLLTIPRNADYKVPAVVLVHGSGSTDMDETIFDNKPFRDIAEYLSSNGVAVIRYNKRTLTYGARMAEHGSFTVWEETIEDAILATEILKADPRIDENRVYILGHSLGGMLAPRIHAMGGDYAGIILFSGSPRFLLDISKAQNIAISKTMIEGKEKDDLLEVIEQWDDYYGQFLTMPDEEAKNTVIPRWGGVTAYYFKDMYLNPSSMFIENITVPFLVMQPNDDVQVLTVVDYAMYRKMLAVRTNVTFKLYPGLNHLFMPSRGYDISEIMDEYRIKSNVDPKVLSDIAEWIKSDK